MPLISRVFYTTLLGCAVLSSALAQTAEAKEPPSETAITIYSKATPGAVDPNLYRPAPGTSPAWQYASNIPGYAMVRSVRSVEMKDARSIVKLQDVAALIDPTTVTFASKTDPEHTTVLEQQFLFDLVSQEKLLERYIDQPVEVEQLRGESLDTVKGTLLNASNGALIIQTDDNEVVTLTNYQHIRFPSLPGGLITRPTLEWLLNTQKTGKHQVEITYETAGVTWWADYNATFIPGKDAMKGLLHLGAWVSIINRSGASYKDALLKLVAGDVNRSAAAPQAPLRSKRMTLMADAAVEEAGFSEQALFEYHLYRLERPTTLLDNSTKQIELFPKAMNIPVQKAYVVGNPVGGYYRTLAPFYQQTNQVAVFLLFNNDKKAGLGIPLPAGRIRVSQQDPKDQSLEFIGENTIAHTPKDEPIAIKLGNAFDITTERNVTNQRQDQARKISEQTIEITLHNHKEEPVTVSVFEELAGYQNWKISDNSDSYEKIDSSHVSFQVNLKKDEKKTVRYTVHYSW